MLAVGRPGEPLEALLDRDASDRLAGGGVEGDDLVFEPKEAVGGAVLAAITAGTFDTDAKSSNDTIFVLSDDEAGGAPIAIHRVIAP